jgi:hypothetical protein
VVPEHAREPEELTKHTPIILIMQRLHERDLAGWLLGDGGNGEVWEHVCLPALRTTAPRCGRRSTRSSSCSS